LIDSNYARANRLLTENIKILHLMAEALMKYETIDSEQITDLMAGKTPKPPKDWTDTDSGSKVQTPPSAGESAEVTPPTAQIGGAASSL
jgi:cell division protease FtsH